MMMRKKIINDLKGHGRQEARLRIHFVGGGKNSLFVPEGFNFLCET